MNAALAAQLRRWRHADPVLALYALLATLPLVFGGAPTAISCGVSLALTLLALAALRRRARSGELVTLGYAEVLALLALIATALQLIPLPQSALQYIAPGAHAAAQVNGTAARWLPVTFDVAATAHEAVKLAGVLAALLVFGLAPSARTVHLHAVLATSGVASLVLGAVFYGPGPAARDAITHGTFVNPNHAAAYFAVGGFGGLSWAMAGRGRERTLGALACVLCGLGIFLTLSRGAILAFMLAVLALALLTAHKSSARQRWLLGALVLSILGGAALYARKAIVHELSTLNEAHTLTKIQLWRLADAIILEAPWTGIGRGALNGVVSRHLDTPLLLSVHHMENEWLQLVVDWGVVGLLLGLSVVALWGLASLGRPLGVRQAVATTALGFLGLHNLVDFNLAILGVLLPAALLFSDLLRHRLGARATALSLAPAQARVLPLALIALVVALSSVALLHGLERDTRLLREDLADSPASEVDAVTQRRVRYHAGDFVLPLIAAERWLREPGGERSALRWINRGLYHAPTFSGGHRLAGRALMRLGITDQALLEYRLACRWNTAVCYAIADEVMARTGDLKQVARLVDRSVDAARAVASYLLKQRAYALVVEQLAPLEPEARLQSMLAESHLQLGDNMAALAAARLGEQLRPGWPDNYVWQALAHERLGDIDAALAALSAGLRVAERRDVLQRHQAEILLRTERFDEAQQALVRLTESAADFASQAQAHAMLAALYERRGLRVRAQQQADRAVTFDPKSVAHRLLAARLRAAAGDRPGAQRVLRQALQDLGPQEELLQLRAALERDAAAGTQ